MLNVNVLVRRQEDPNGNAVKFPFIYYKHELGAAGFRIDFVHNLSKKIFDCDLIIVSSKFFKKYWQDNEKMIIEFLETANNRNIAVIWLDATDSTGTTQFQVLPYVKKYYKAQTLKDKQLYLSKHHSNRIISHYYFTKYNVTDMNCNYQSVIADKKYLDKIDTSWNSSLGEYHLYGPLKNRLRGMLYLHIPMLLNFRSPTSRRRNKITTRIGMQYHLNTIKFHRELLQKKLSMKYHIQTNKISRTDYFREMEDSEIGISPFGLGEISLRDFEIIVSGTLLMKPNMDHLVTWPHLYEKGVTYWDYDWDCDYLLERIEMISEDDDLRFSIAENAQRRYGAVFDKHSKDSILRRLLKMLEESMK